MKKILGYIIKIILSAAVIVNLILTILLFKNYENIQKDLYYMDRDISSISNNVYDISDTVTDIEDDISDIKYYLY
jgi:hypothetical protein